MSSPINKAIKDIYESRSSVSGAHLLLVLLLIVKSISRTDDLTDGSLDCTWPSNSDPILIGHIDPS